VNVCGYVWAKNGNGLYSGSSRLVVGLDNGKAIGIISELTGGAYSDEEHAVIASDGDAICTTPFADLYKRVLDMIMAEIDADADAKAAAQRCYQDRDAKQEELRGSSGSQYGDQLLQILQATNSCIGEVATAHRQAYSRILGYDYSGHMGAHTPDWMTNY